MKFKHKSAEPRSIWVGIAVAAGISLAVTLVLAAILSTMIARGQINMNNMHILSFVITTVAALAGGVFAGKYIQEKPAIICGIAVLVYGIILLFSGILFFDGEFSSPWTSLFAIIAGYIGSCTICLSKTSGKYNRKRRSR